MSENEHEDDRIIKAILWQLAIMSFKWLGVACGIGAVIYLVLR